MDIIADVRTEAAVYWEPLATPGNEGQVRYAAPVELDPAVGDGVKWFDQSVAFVDNFGQTQLSNAVVMVGRDLKERGVLCRGRLDDILYVRDPFRNPGAWEIKKVSKVGTFEPGEYLRVVTL